MKPSKKRMAGLLALATIAPQIAWAEPGPTGESVYDANLTTKPPAKSDKEGQSENTLARLALADRTFAYARQSGSIDSWLVAATLYQDIGQLQQDDSEAPAVPAAPDSFWEEAERAVAGEIGARDRLQRYRTRQSKSLVVKSGLVTLAVLPGANGGRSLRYKGGERAAVQIRDLRDEARLTVFDQNGAVICRTDWNSATKSCTWTPRWTGEFRLVVERRSGIGPVLLATS